jgi:hypothetical protein
VNRKERRAQAAQGRDTMGKSYTLSQLPESITSHPAYKAGQAAAESGKGFPPEYLAAIGVAARLIRRWVAEHPGAELRWLPWDGNRTFIAANLPEGARYLADSPDALALLEWLDAATGRTLSLNMAGWAIRRLGMMPMPDGSYWRGEPS